jgi:RHS repeat-associated protein
MKTNRSIRFIISAIFSLITCALMSPLPIAAQSNYLEELGPPPNGGTTPVEMGFINLNNGNLHLEVPLGSFPQRGNQSYSAKLVYDSRIWVTTLVGPSYNQLSFRPFNLLGIHPQAGWRLEVTNDPTFNQVWYATDTQICDWEFFPSGASWTTYSNFTWTDPNGTVHAWGANGMLTAQTFDQTGVNCSPYGNVPNASGYADDGSGLFMEVTNFTDIVIYGTDGSRLASYSAMNDGTIPPYPEDPNGNYFSLDSNNNVVDTLGRTPVITTISGNNTFYDVLNAQGGRSRFTATAETIPVSVPLYSSTLTVIQSIALPNGTSYQFGYDSGTTGDNWGLINSVTLPTGGQVSYGYTTFLDSSGSALNSNRWVSSRTSGGGPWHYTPQVINNQAGGCPGGLTPGRQQVTVLKPDNSSMVYKTMLVAGSPVNYETDYYSQSGGLLKQGLATYAGPDCSVQPYPPGLPQTLGYSPILPLSIVTTTYGAGGAGLTTQKTYGYTNSPSIGQPTTVSEWDYFQGSAPATPNRMIQGVYTLMDPTEAAAHITGKPSTVTLTDGVGNWIAQTSYTYDNYTNNALASTAGCQTTSGSQPLPAAPQHDYKNYCTTNVIRGNLTQVSRWLNSTGTSITTTTNRFDDTGNIVKTADALSHATQFTYSPAFGLAYPTQIQNALGHITTKNYDFNTGLLLSDKDPNGQVTGLSTTYTYDNMGRLTNTTLPDGGSTTVDFHADSVPFSVTSTQIATPNPSIAATTTFDGYGRPVTKCVTDPEGDDCIDTVYDPNGRVQSVSNPHRSVASPSDGITSFSYDGLDRQISVQEPDQNVVSNVYDVQTSPIMGQAVIATDETGRQRRAVIDGFGRLVEADEPGGVPSGGVQATASVAISGAFNSTWAGAGTPHLAATGTAIASVTMSDGSSHDFYFDTNQHLCQMSWISGSGWFDQDLTSMTEAALPLAGSSVAAAVLNGVIHVFYQGADLHIYDMNWTGSVWQNVDMTALTGASAMSGTKMSTVLTGNPNSPMMFYEGANQHLFTVYWNSSANAWQNADLNALSGATTLMAVKASFGSVMFSGNGGVYVFYIGTNQHLIDINWDGTSRWLTGDLTIASGGAALAVSGSAVTTVATGTTIDLMGFYEGSNQHIYSIYWNGSAGAWQTLDFTAFSGATNVAAVQTALTNQIAPQIFYFGSNQHLDDIYWNGSAWVNADVTSLANTTVVAASGSSLSSHGTAGPNTYNLFFEGSNQHIYHTYYNPGAPGWFNEDPLVAASNFVVDSGTVSLTIPNGGSKFTATVCYGVSTNPFCAGKPVNASLTDIANALAAVLNGAGSPVNASTDGATLNLTWRTPGFVTTSVAAMTSSSDNPSLFPVGSFTSTSATFSGGVTPGSQSLASPLVTLYRYDGLGNLTCVEQHGNTTGSGCSPAVMAITDNQPPAADASSPWRIRRGAYDSLGRLRWSSDPESGLTSFQYNTDDVLISATDARGITVNFNPADSPIDALHRATKKTYSNGEPAVTYTYDVVSYNSIASSNQIGQLVHMYNGVNAASTFAYDSIGRLIKQTNCLPSNCTETANQVIAMYDLAGSLNMLLYPSGRKLLYSYNSAGHFTKVNFDSFNGTTANFPYYSVPLGTGASNWGYWPTGTMRTGVSGNGVQQTLGINPRQQLNSITQATTVHTLLSKTYGVYDSFAHNNGDILNITDGLNTGNNQTYTYDGLNRISSGLQADGTFNVNFSYDAWSNMTQSGTTNFQPLFDLNNRIIGAPSNCTSATTYCYDAAGNLLNDAFHQYTYDAEGHMKIVDGTVATYTYGADGTRIRKDVGTAATEFIFFGGDVIAEKNVATGNWTDYIMAYGARIAKDASANASGAQYFHSDQIKSTRLVTDNTGAVIWQAIYSPFGQELSTQKSDIRFQYGGMEYDSETALNHTEFRQYASAEGRWLSPDPYTGSVNLANPQSLNRYAYVLNNPLIMNDPKGLDCIYDTEAAKDSNLPGQGIIRGDCLSDKDGGIFVDGTVNQAIWSPGTDSVSFRYRENDEAGTLVSPAAGFSGLLDPMDSMNAYFREKKYEREAAGSDVPLTATAQSIITQVGIQTGGTTKQINCAAAFLYPLLPGPKPEDIEAFLSSEGADAANEGLESQSDKVEALSEKLKRAKKRGTSQASRVAKKESKMLKQTATAVKWINIGFQIKEGYENYKECQAEK